MTLRGTWFTHTDFVEHGCCRVVDHDGEPWQCGQYCGHDGGCTWFTPGSYLPPPLIGPLAWLAVSGRSPWPWRRWCPLCGEPVGSVTCEPTTAMYEDEIRSEVRWEFQPCGCEGRELAGAEAAYTDSGAA